MRWSAVNHNHRVGDKRKITKFAWIPMVVEDKWIWLESYWSWEKYWPFNDEWLEIQRYLK